MDALQNPLTVAAVHKPDLTLDRCGQLINLNHLNVNCVV